MSSQLDSLDINVDISNEVLIDITKPLQNELAEMYCNFRARGKNKRESYILAKKKPEMKANAANQGVFKLERKFPQILDRITYIKSSIPPEVTPETPEYYKLETPEHFIAYYRAKATSLDTRDPEALKAAKDLATLLDITGVQDHDRNKADPTKVLDVFIQAGLDGLSPADAVIKAFNEDYAAISRHLSDIFGCKVVLTPNVAVIPDDTAQVNDTQPID